MHNRGKGAKFTKGGVWKLVCVTRFESDRVAKQAEYGLKHLKSADRRTKCLKLRKAKNLCKLLCLEKMTRKAPRTASLRAITVYWNQAIREQVAQEEWPNNVHHRSLEELREHV